MFAAEPLELTQIAMRRGAAEGFSRALESLGLKPPAPGCVSMAQGRELLWLQPDTYLLLGNTHGLEALAPHAMMVDQSDGRSCFMLVGPDAAAMLARGCRVDLHPRAFGPGRVVSTSLAHVNALIQQCDATRFRVIVFSSFARHIADWLEHASAAA